MPRGFPLPPIGVAGFADAGWAWDFIGASRLGSAGFGVYLGGGVYPAIRWNWAWRTFDFEHFQSRPVRQFMISYDF